MGFDYGKTFRVLHMPDDLGEFRTLLGAGNFGEPAANRLVKLIESRCKSVVLEREYIDGDYRAGFARFHYLRHHDTNRRCHRLHFFSPQLNRRHLLHMPIYIAQGYLGFTVIRPLPGFRLGRSLLSSRLMPDLPSGELEFITCKARCRANLAGNELKFDGVPWMEQDTLVSACASAALWVASSYLASKFAPEFREYYTPEITDLATRYVVTTGRAMPSIGLTVEQMMYAIREMGYEPVPHDPASSFHAHNIVYRYVESEIPVIVAVQFPSKGGHVLTAVGHTYVPTASPIIEKFEWLGGVVLRFSRSSSFASSFIVQDDAGGPFRRLELLNWNEAARANLISKRDVKELSHVFSCVVVLDRGSSSQEVGFLQALIGLLPPEVTLDGEAAELRALFTLASWYETLEVNPPELFVLRTYLQRSNELKERFTRHVVPLADLRREFRRHLMSKWVWVTEVAELGDFLSNGQCFGLIVQDAASHANSPDFLDLIAFYLPGGLVTLRPDGHIESFSIPEGQRLPVLKRSAY